MSQCSLTWVALNWLSLFSTRAPLLLPSSHTPPSRPTPLRPRRPRRPRSPPQSFLVIRHPHSLPLVHLDCIQQLLCRDVCESAHIPSALLPGTIRGETQNAKRIPHSGAFHHCPAPNAPCFESSIWASLSESTAALRCSAVASCPTCLRPRTTASAIATTLSQRPRGEGNHGLACAHPLTSRPKSTPAGIQDRHLASLVPSTTSPTQHRNHGSHQTRVRPRRGVNAADSRCRRHANHDHHQEPHHHTHHHCRRERDDEHRVFCDRNSSRKPRRLEVPKPRQLPTRLSPRGQKRHGRVGRTELLLWRQDPRKGVAGRQQHLRHTMCGRQDHQVRWTWPYVGSADW